MKELNKACAWGERKIVKVKLITELVYKRHLDVPDSGIPISALVTGANVHDSQVAILMEKLTQLYSLMDAAYDTPEIRQDIKDYGRIDLI